MADQNQLNPPPAYAPGPPAGYPPAYPPGYPNALNPKGCDSKSKAFPYYPPPPPPQIIMMPQQQQQQQQQQTQVNVSVGAPQSQVVVVKRGVNHCMHCCISLFFWPWIIVWIVLCIIDD